MLNPEELERYARHIVMRDVGGPGQAKLKAARVLVIGAGGLGAPALMQAGLSPDRLICVEAGDDKQLLACFEEGLRYGGLGAVIAEVANRVRPSGLARATDSAAGMPLPPPLLSITTGWPQIAESRSA